MKHLFLLIPLAFGLITGSAEAAHVDYFLKLDGVDGESTDTRNPGQIEVLSFNFGITQTGSGAAANGGGGGAGKVAFQDVTFVARASKASPQLMLFCASGQHFSSLSFVAYRSADAREPYLKIELQDVLVTSYQTSASDGGAAGPVPTDQFSVNYTKIVYTYIALDGKETFGEAIRPALTQ